MPPSDLIERLFRRAGDMELASTLPGLAGIEPERLSAIEAKEPVSAAEYERLCRALAVDPVAMYRGEEAQPRRVPARFRAALSADRPNAQDMRTLALAVEVGAILAHLLAQLRKEVELADHRVVLGEPGSRETWRRGYELGEAARERLRPDFGPIHDLGDLLREVGVHVARVTFDSRDLDAASVWEPGAVPIILVNDRATRASHPGAHRATLAHELCHLLHDGGEDDLTTRVSWGDGHNNYAEAIEIRARAFAPAFLAPREQVKSWAETRPSRERNNSETLIATLAEAWGLSFEGAAWHAKNCQLVSPEEAERMANRSRKPSIDYGSFETTHMGVPPSMVHPSLPDEVAPIWDGWATEIVLAALEEEHITVGRARELLTWG